MHHFKQPDLTKRLRDKTVTSSIIRSIIHLIRGKSRLGDNVASRGRSTLMSQEASKPSITGILKSISTRLISGWCSTSSTATQPFSAERKEISSPFKAPDYAAVVPESLPLHRTYPEPIVRASIQSFARLALPSMARHLQKEKAKCSASGRRQRNPCWR